MQLQIHKTQPASQPASSKLIGWKSFPMVLVLAMLVGSCDGSIRKSGWFIGGSDRRIVDSPTDNADPFLDLLDDATDADISQPGKSSPNATSKNFPNRALEAAKAAKAVEEIRGTGSFSNATPRPNGVQTTQAGGSVMLNFVDADIRDVIKTVLGTTLGRNFAIDPKVKGTITLQTNKAIPRAAVIPTLESALRLNGLVLVRSGDLYKITAARAAAQSAGRPRFSGLVGKAGSAYGVEILPLEFAAATEMAKIIEPLAPSGAVIRTDIVRNLLIVGGTKYERETIADIVSIFDVDWLLGMSFALVPLQYAQPKEAITDLERVFGTTNGGPLEGLVRFFPVERRQSVLVISAKPAYIERTRDWIKLLDVGGEDQERLYVYSVENARAVDLAAILSQVFSDSPSSTPSRSVAPEQRATRLSSQQTGTGTTQNQNTVGAQAFGRPVSAAQATPAPASTSPRARATPRGRAGNAPAGQAANRQNGSEVSGDLPEELSARIIPDDVNNSLVIMARPGVWRMIEEALRKLDVVPLQVLIEATVAEVTLNDDLRYGVQSFFDEGNTTTTLSSIASGTIASTFPGFSFVFDDGNIRTILDALDSVTDIRIISAPQVLVLDNRTAELQVGDQVPVSTQSSVSNTDGTAPTVNTVDFRDTGTVLRVTPRVNASGVVNLEIEQEQSSAVATTSSGIDSPTIQQRRLRTTVLVNSGETVALGGLISDTQTDAKSGIPLLSSIPILGNLFGSTSETGRRTEILILVTPRVIRNQEEARSVTRDLRETLHNAAALKRFRNYKK
jgi:general secretion pathway protein D